MKMARFCKIKIKIKKTVKYGDHFSILQSKHKDNKVIYN